MKYQKKWGVVVFSLCCAIMLLGVQAWAGGIQTFARDTSWNDSYSKGMALYKDNCAACHGENGEGGASEDASGLPLNLQSFLTIAPKDFIAKTIVYGRASRGMPSFGGDLSAKQVDQLATYVKGWQTQPSKEVEAGAVVGDPFEGEKWFAGLCVGCHGSRGEGGSSETGGGQLLESFAAFSAPSLADPGFKKAASDGFIKASLIYGRIGTPMSSYLKGQQGQVELSEKDINDIVSYIRTMPTVE